MPFTIPDESSAGHADQAEPKTLDFQALAQRNTGVVSGCVVTAQSVPDMTVAVSSGTVRVAGTSHAVTGANVTITSNGTANPRYDAVVANSSGVLSAIAGTAAPESTLDQPAVDVSAYAVLAIVYVGPGAASIGAPEIVRKDIPMPDAHAEIHAINGADHTGTLDDGQIPSGIARDTEVASAVSTHSGAADPHGDRAAASTDAGTQISTHAGLADPHTGYQKESEKGVASGYAGLDSNAVVPANQLPLPTASLLGGVKSLAGVSHLFLSAIGTDGVPVATQPTYSDISGSPPGGATYDSVLPNPVGTAATGGITGPTVLNAGIDTNGAAFFTTGSVAIASHYDELLTLAVFSVGGADPNIPTLTTARGLNIAQVATRLNSTDHTRLTIFRTCIASGGSTGALVIDFGGQTQDLGAWELVSWIGTGATAANNGSDGIGVSGSATATSNVTVTPAFTLAALTAGSATYAVSQHAANELSVAGTGYTELSDVHAAGPNTGFETVWKLDGTTTPSATWTTGAHANIVAVEILSQAGGQVVARRAHVHATGAGTPSTQAFGDAATVGTGPAAAMTDHLHAMPALGTTAAAVGTSAGGSATTPSKSDHVHATGAGTPSTQLSGDAAAVGSGPAAAMTDHKHAMWNDFIAVTFSKQGAVAVTTDATAGRWYNDTGRTLTFSSIRATAVTAPTGATLIVDVNVDGTTIFTTQGNRAAIAISGNTAKVTNPDVTTIADGHYITVNVDQIGSTVAGSDLTVQVFLKG